MTELTQTFLIGGNALNAWYVTGMTDGDGHFGININKVNGKVTLEFKITSHCSSEGVLKDLQKFFGVGRINIDNRRDNTLKFVVSSLSDIINVIIPHFTAYPLQGSKYLNLLAFKKAALLMQEGYHLTPSGLEQLIALAVSMNKGRSFSEKFNWGMAYPRDLTMFWLLGFLDAEACFYTYIPQVIGRSPVAFTVEIAQATHEASLLASIAALIGSGYIKPKYNIFSLSSALSVRPVSRLIVGKNLILLDFLASNPLLTTKHLDFLDWKRMLLMHEAGQHLTPQGLAQMKAIKAGMNQGRSKTTLANRLPNNPLL